MESSAFRESAASAHSSRRSSLYDGSYGFSHGKLSVFYMHSAWICKLQAARSKKDHANALSLLAIIDNHNQRLGSFILWILVLVR